MDQTWSRFIFLHRVHMFCLTVSSTCNTSFLLVCRKSSRLGSNTKVCNRNVRYPTKIKKNPPLFRWNGANYLRWRWIGVKHQISKSTNSENQTVVQAENLIDCHWSIDQIFKLRVASFFLNRNYSDSMLENKRQEDKRIQRKSGDNLVNFSHRNFEQFAVDLQCISRRFQINMLD